MEAFILTVLEDEDEDAGDDADSDAQTCLVATENRRPGERRGRKCADGRPRQFKYRGELPRPAEDVTVARAVAATMKSYGACQCYSGARQQLGRCAVSSVLSSVSREERPAGEAPCLLQSIDNVAGQSGD